MPTRESLHAWKLAVDKFFQWQSREVVGKGPSPEVLDDQRELLKFLLSITRLLCAQVVKPDFPFPEFRAEVQGKLLQLEAASEMMQNPISHGEAEAYLSRLSEAFRD